MSIAQETESGAVKEAGGDSGRSPRTRWPWVVCSLVCAVAIAVSVTVIYIVTRSDSGSAATSTGSTASGSTISSAASVPASSYDTYRAGNARACAALEQYGRAFYTGTYQPLMTQSNGGHASMDVDPIELSAQLGVLYSQLDTSTLSGASPAVHDALSQSASDADALAQSFANIGVYGGKSPNMTSIVNSFTNALAACTMAGFQPSYFDPQALVGR